jgi:hypothetical protein
MYLPTAKHPSESRKIKKIISAFAMSGMQKDDTG